MSEQIEKKAAGAPVFLQTKSFVRPYAEDDLISVFQDMANEWGAKIVPSEFGRAATSIGTHAPKLYSARSKMFALYLPKSNGNQPDKLAISGDSKLGKYAKTIFRPIAIIGQEGEASFFQRVISGDALVPRLFDAFGSVFGEEARKYLEAGFEERLKPSEISLSGDNYPVFYLPGVAGGSMQASVAGSVEAHVNMFDLKEATWEARKNKDITGRSIYGEWLSLSFSDNAQNLIMGAPKTRTRFHAKMPQVLGNLEAEIWRYLSGGNFPRLRDDAIISALIDYAQECHRLSDVKSYRGGRVMEAHQNRAEFIARATASFISEVLESCRDENGDLNVTAVPSISGVLSRTPIFSALKGRDDLPEVITTSYIRQILLSDHFRDAADKFEVVL